MTTIIVGQGGASVEYPSGITLYFDEDEEIILDNYVPLGFFAGSAFPFVDVPESVWFYDGIAFAYHHGLFMGTSADMFSPNIPMTRGMLVTVLRRAASLPTSTNSGVFADVLSGEYYSDAVDWAVEQGVAIGVGGGQFSPDVNITREQLVTMLMHFARHMGIDTTINATESSFDDNSDISSWAADAVAWAQEKGIVIGKPGNIFDPQAGATRAEVAAVLTRFIGMEH